MAPHSSTLAWKIPWMEEPGRLQSMGSLRVGHDFTFTFHYHALEEEMATHSSVLAWRIPGTEEPRRLLSMGLHRVGHDWSDLAAAVAAAFIYLFMYLFKFCNRTSCWGLDKPLLKVFYSSHFRIPMKLVCQSSLTQSIIRHILDFPSYLHWDTAYLAKKKGYYQIYFSLAMMSS